MKSNRAVGSRRLLRRAGAGSHRDARSENLFDHVNWSSDANFTRTNSKQSIQERVLRVRRLEAWERPKIRRFFRSVIFDAFERHVNERTVVRLERDPQVELEDTVGALEHPVAAAREYLAAKPVALERASEDRKREASTVRSRADVLRGRRAEPKGHEGTRTHGVPPIGRCGRDSNLRGN